MYDAEIRALYAELIKQAEAALPPQVVAAVERLAARTKTDE